MVRFHTAGPLARAPAFEASQIGAIPIPAANTPVGFLVRSPAPQAGEAGFNSRTGDHLRAYPNRQRNNVESVASVRSNRTARTMGR